jgi:DNA-binding CsgD family transcriptional regulator
MPTDERERGTRDVTGTEGLLERNEELAALGRALDAAGEGAGRVVIVEGEPGIGKSRLLDWTRERAQAAGMRVLNAWGLELEREFPFGVALRLLEPALDNLSQAQRHRVFAGPAASAVTLFDGTSEAAGADSAGAPRALLRALRQLVVNLASMAPESGKPSLAIVLDDAQWADQASLRFLVHLSASVGVLPVALALAVRRGARDAPAELSRGLAVAPQAHVLRLRALSEAGVERLVRRVFPNAAPAFVRACAGTSGGNPFYLGELLESARVDGIPGTAESAARVEGLAPESVVTSVLLRLAALPDPASALASAVAVLGDGASLADAATLAEIDGQAAEQAADTLAAAQVLCAGEPLTFVHPLIGAAVHADLPPLARSRAHRRAAELLDDAGSSVERVAPHLLASRPNGDGWTVERLRLAAQRASARSDPQGAQRILARALAEPPSPEVRPRVLVDLALAYAATGATDAVARVEAALEVVERELRVDALRSLARLLFARSQFDRAAEAADRALSELDPGDPRHPQVVVESLAIAAVGARAPTAATDQLATMLKAAEAGRLPTDPGLLAQLAAAMLASGRPADEVAMTARLALAGLPPDDGFYGIIIGFAVVALICADDLPAAASRITLTLDRAAATGSLIARGMASHWLALLRYHQGDLGGALLAGEQALEVADAGWDVCTGWVAPLLAHCHIEREELQAAADVLQLTDRLDPERPESSVSRAARARLAELSGDPAGALVALLAAGERAERDGIGPLMVRPWRSSAALAAVRSGDREQANRLADTELAQARAGGAPRTLGIALGAAGVARGGPEGLDLLREAVDVLERSPAALEHCRALTELGAALRREGYRVDSRDPLRHGLELADSLGARALAGQARQELRAAGGRRRPPRATSGADALTPTEGRIAQLAARGLTTPQIAQTLYIAPKTVDWHLGHAYHKLGINSRRKLPHALLSQSGAHAAGDS